MSGWIKIHRKLSDNPIWTCEPFTRGQAWVDLLMLANYEKNFFYVRNIKVDVKRGQVAWSEPKLANRWGWSRTKLRKFLNDLEKEQQLIQQKGNVTQIITIINYDEYQNKEQQEDSKKTARRRREESKELKERKEAIAEAEKNFDNTKNWKKDFDTYKAELRREYKAILKDEDWLSQQERYNSSLDIKLSIEKAVVNYWATEEGWDKKRKSKAQSIDWRRTLSNALSLTSNKVYKKGGFNSQPEKEPKYKTIKL